MTSPTPEQIAAMDADIANTARAALWHARQRPMVSPDSREVQLALKNTINRNAWRIKAGLPMRPSREQVAGWHALLNLRGHLRAWRRNHPITTPPRAA